MPAGIKDKIKIGLITSKGGHLFQLIQLKNLIKHYDRFWVTDKGNDVSEYLKKERIYYGNFPDSRNLFNLLRNLIMAFIILRKEKPQMLISCGAGIAVPFFLVGKYLFGQKLIFLETYDFIAFPSLTGKILYKFVDLFLIQHNVQKKWYPRANYWGKVL